MALRLIYQMFAKLMSWMVLHGRSENAKEIEILLLRLNWLCYGGTHLGHGSAGSTAP